MDTCWILDGYMMDTRWILNDGYQMMDNLMKSRLVAPQVSPDLSAWWNAEIHPDPFPMDSSSTAYQFASDWENDDEPSNLGLSTCQTKPHEHLNILLNFHWRTWLHNLHHISDIWLRLWGGCSWRTTSRWLGNASPPRHATVLSAFPMKSPSIHHL